jgi:hypothetical protein
MDYFVSSPEQASESGGEMSLLVIPAEAGIEEKNEDYG